ncbi:MAG: hydrogenase maturation nickel metallochaperone HypA [Sulfurimonas sp.]|uniref:hydrogenase maturation nickel metallochaperone HypA n=1 Tax=Sulfurimonas sp. TaxID=2022749 RepID=UPI00260F4296|nr:hydrogenase maturation nickel metallochaperone HypA [Sulfurimonas sp.]MCW8894352.1 hydrogenase maturation nickel metallochaperone HypA [Sulfurimonas sp.]MCW8954255.1 hydrogenase maturation nickel metallochaperone HypA [Sulfurimonas sp.]MCW9067371.1 hydrogenase maturation nickel metallochaperone HypA [Sulfurimonas sp.]
MHEYSIVQSLIESCQEHVKANDATRVTKVEVKIGVLSGVEPHLLREAFDTFKEETICHEAEFVMNIQKVKIHCNSCKQETELEKNEFVCPKCGSYELNVLDGEEMYLMSLELE